MPEQEVLKRLEERLTRLEATLSNAGSFQVPGGTIADPAPWPGPYFVPRPLPYPNPVVDPAPWGGGVPWWGGAFGGYRVPFPIPNPVADPAPWGGGFNVAPRLPIGTIGQIGDPPPIDISRFSVEQLESSLHSIAAERARLDSMEKLVKQQMERLKSRG